MKPFISIFLILLSNLLYAQSSREMSRSELIDSLLQESHKRGIFNGNALVMEKGKEIYHGGVGFADGSQTTRFEPGLRFLIGSISKQFDGVGIMMLMEQGKLSLESQLSDFFPHLPEWSKKIRISHLLQYTSGLIPPDFQEVRTDAQIWTYLVQLDTLGFEPGTAYNYNNLDVFLRKRIIEKVSGKTYSRFINESILEPCTMVNTLFDPTAETPNFTRSFDESYIEDDLDFYMKGVIATTTTDMYKWLQCLKSGSVISNESLQQLAESFSSSSQSPLGLSAYKEEKLLFRYHHGQQDNFEAGVVWIPDSEFTIILLTNNRCNELGDHINAIDAILRGNEFDIPKRSIELSLRSKIFHGNLEEGLIFLDYIRENEADIYNFSQEEKELVNTSAWLLEKNRIEDGIKFLEIISVQFPRSVGPLLVLGAGYEKAGEIRKARDNYREVLELEPDNSMALAKLDELRE